MSKEWELKDYAWDSRTLVAEKRTDHNSRGLPPSSPKTGRKGRGRPSQILCKVDGCNENLDGIYYRKYRVCSTHAKMPAVMVGGQTVRFCQKCSRFHDLSEFDLDRRSCRDRLAQHNKRRRDLANSKHKSSHRKPRKPSRTPMSNSSTPPTTATTTTTTPDISSVCETNSSHDNKATTSSTIVPSSTVLPPPHQFHQHRLLNNNNNNNNNNYNNNYSNPSIQPSSMSLASLLAPLASTLHSLDQVYDTFNPSIALSNHTNYTNNNNNNVQQHGNNNNNNNYDDDDDALLCWPDDNGVPPQDGSDDGIDMLQSCNGSDIDVAMGRNNGHRSVYPSSFNTQHGMNNIHTTTTTTATTTGMAGMNTNMPSSYAMMNSLPTIINNMGTNRIGTYNSAAAVAAAALRYAHTTTTTNTMAANTNTNTTTTTSSSFIPSTTSSLSSGREQSLPEQQQQLDAFIPINTTTTNTIYTPEDVVIRISLKFFSCLPNELPATLRSDIEEMLQVNPLIFEGYLRPGCTHVTVDLRVDKKDSQRLESSNFGSAMTCILDAIRMRRIENGEDECDKKGLIQLFKEVVLMQSTSVCASISVKGPRAPSLTRIKPLCISFCDDGDGCLGDAIQVDLHGHHIGRCGDLVLCRQHGRHLTVDMMDPRPWGLSTCDDDHSDDDTSNSDDDDNDDSSSSSDDIHNDNDINSSSSEYDNDDDNDDSEDGRDSATGVLDFPDAASFDSIFDDNSMRTTADDHIHQHIGRHGDRLVPIRILGLQYGVAEIEVQCGGALTEARPLLVLPDHEAVREVRRLSDLPSSAVWIDSLLRDIGLVVGYVYKNGEAGRATKDVVMRVAQRCIQFCEEHGCVALVRLLQRAAMVDERDEEEEMEEEMEEEGVATTRVSVGGDVSGDDAIVSHSSVSSLSSSSLMMDEFDDDDVGVKQRRGEEDILDVMKEHASCSSKVMYAHENVDDYATLRTLEIERALLWSEQNVNVSGMLKEIRFSWVHGLLFMLSGLVGAVFARATSAF